MLDRFVIIAPDLGQSPFNIVPDLGLGDSKLVGDGLLGGSGHLHLYDLGPPLLGDYLVPVLFSHILATDSGEELGPGIGPVAEVSGQVVSDEPACILIDSPGHHAEMLSLDVDRHCPNAEGECTNCECNSRAEDKSFENEGGLIIDDTGECESCQ